MKKLLSVLPALLLLCGCAAKPVPKTDMRLSVVASAFPEWDFARIVAGEYADVVLLLKPGAEPHSYEPSPQDILRIEQADIFIYGGGESDEWITRILESGSSSERQVLSLMDCVSLREEEIQAFMTSKDEEASDEAEYDEHVWTSPKNAARIVRSVCTLLCEADAAHAESYQANAEAYLSKLDALDASFSALAAEAERKLLVFGDRFPFLYLVREYGLDYAAAFPGCSDATDVNPSTVAHLIDVIRNENIPVVFRCDLSSGAIADTLSEATGAKVLTLYSCHTVSQTDFLNGESYLSLMERNLSALKEALNGCR